MTFPRVYKKGKPKTFDNVDKEATKLRMNRAVPSEYEIKETLREADKIENEYFRLRAKAIIALAKIFARAMEGKSAKVADTKAVHIVGDNVHIICGRSKMNGSFSVNINRQKRVKNYNRARKD